MYGRELDDGTLSNEQLMETIHYTTDVLLIPISPVKISVGGGSVINYGVNTGINTTIKTPIKMVRDYSIGYHIK